MYTPSSTDRSVGVGAGEIAGGGCAGGDCAAPIVAHTAQIPSAPAIAAAEELIFIDRDMSLLYHSPPAPLVDSKGNIYTTETYEGKRLQKFAYKSMGPVSANQGVVWPSK